MKTPQPVSVTLIAGQRLDVAIYGTWVCFQTIAGVGVTTISWAVDNDSLQNIEARKTVGPFAEHYNLIHLYNPAAVPVSVTLYAGETPVQDNGADATLLAVLSAISARLAGVATLTQSVVATLPATGGAGQLIFAANPNRKKLSIEAALTNTGTVYLGNAAAHCSDVDCLAQLAAGQPCPEDTYQGAVYGVGSDAAQQVVCYQE